MKLYDGAVLLIIGAAVVGPIEPPYAPIDAGDFASLTEGVPCTIPMDIDRMGVRQVSPSWPLCVLNRRRVMESTAETCERAMWEIGAWQVAPIKEQSPGWDKRFLPGHWYLDGTLDGDKPAREIICIPAPSGLRK